MDRICTHEYVHQTDQAPPELAQGLAMRTPLPDGICEGYVFPLFEPMLSLEFWLAPS